MLTLYMLKHMIAVDESSLIMSDRKGCFVNNNLVRYGGVSERVHTPPSTLKTAAFKTHYLIIALRCEGTPCHIPLASTPLACDPRLVLGLLTFPPASQSSAGKRRMMGL